MHSTSDGRRRPWSSRGDRLAAITLIAFPAAIALFLVPSAIFLSNQAHFYYDATVLAPFLGLLTAWIVLGSASWWLTDSIRSRLATIGFWLGVWLLGRDLVVPLEMGRLIGFDGNPSAVQSRGALAVELVLSLVVVAVAMRARVEAWLRPAAVAVVTLLGLQIAMLVAGAEMPTRAFARARLLGASPGWLNGEALPGPSSAAGNLYHLLLDCYSSYALPTALNDLGLTASALEGFVYFPRNRSNYDVTAPSVASLMSGSFYREGSLRDWRHAWTRDGLISTLMRAGYTTWLYPAHEHYDRQPFHHMRVLPAAGVAGSADALRRVVLLRLAPSPLRPWVFANVDPARIGTPEQLRDYMRTLIDDEAARPASGQYVFMHLYLPHGPYGLDGECNAMSSATYLDQTTCATRLLMEFLYELRRLGRYEHATVIVHGDHGCQVGDPQTVSLANANNRLNGETTVGEIDRATAALLLVKPPGAPRAPLKISDRWTELADIPRTIYDVIGLKVGTVGGRSVLADDYPLEPERHVFLGYLRYDNGRQQWFGRDILEGVLDHFTWSPASGWIAKPAVAAYWE